MKFQLAVALLLPLVIASPAVAQDDTKPKPCGAPEHRQFDFWIGTWDVHNAAGKVAGTNTITQILGTCVLEEHWKGAGGSEGKSFNMYSAANGKWYQTWVDNSGNRLDLSGGLVDGNMVLSGKTKTPKGMVLDKITWSLLDDGRVRQHWERSPDDGKTWNDLFIGFYTKKE